MDIFRQVAFQILFLIVVAAIWMGILFAVGWVLGTAIRKIIRWLLGYKQVERLVLWIQQTIRMWWTHSQPEVERLWEFVSEILIDPIFFAYTIFLLFNRLESITEYTTAHPEYSFWQILNLDMERDMNFYMWFLIILTIWMLGKAWMHRQRIRERRSITKVLEAIAAKLSIPEDEYKAVGAKDETLSVNHPESIPQEKVE